MKPALQAKLLHVLQDAEFTKLGSNKRVEVDVRIVAATNRDLERMMLTGDFREDLYYRLRVIEIVVPALRERRDEIPSLIDTFAARYSQKYKRQSPKLSPELRQVFLEYEWPGNIRELENMIKRLVILQDEQLVFAEIQSGARRTLHAVAAGAPAAALAAASPAAYAVPVVPAAVPPLAPAAEPEAPEEVEAPAAETGGSLAAVAKAAALKAERAILEKTLTQVHWNRRKAAQILGVSYKTLLNKIKECNITRD